MSIDGCVVLVIPNLVALLYLMLSLISLSRCRCLCLLLSKGGPTVVCVCYYLKENHTVIVVYAWYDRPMSVCSYGIYVYTVIEWKTGNEDLL